VLLHCDSKPSAFSDLSPQGHKTRRYLVTLGDLREERKFRGSSVLGKRAHPLGLGPLELTYGDSPGSRWKHTRKSRRNKGSPILFLN